LSDLGPLVEYHDQLGDVFYAVDKDWRISVANDAALRFAGLSREEAIGALYWAVVPVRDTPLGRAVVEAVERQHVVQVEVESRLRPGTIVRAIAAPLLDGASVTLRDVSDQGVTSRSSEPELLRPEEHLILAAEAAAIGTYEFDLPSGLGYWSARARAMLGLPDRNRTTEATLFALIDPRDHGRVADVYRRATEGAGGGRYAAEFRIRRQSDGSARWLSARGRVHFRPDGRPLRRVGALIDITDRKAAEERLHESEARLRELNAALEARVAERTQQLRASEESALRLYNRSPVPQHSIDAQGHYLAVSDGWLELMGYTREEVLGRPFFDFVAPFELERLKPAFQRLRAEGEIRDFEYCLVGKDGELRPVLVTTRVEYDEAGQFVRTYGVTLDIRARKKAEAALAREAEERRRAEEQLRQAQKMEVVGQLTGGVAHDFNNLLTIIRSSTDLLRRPDLPAQRRERYLETISQTVDRAAKVTGQLLAFARRQALKPEVFEVSERVAAITGMLRTVLGERVRITSEVSCEQCFVEADAAQFETALVNVAVNARDAMDGAGSFHIQVSRHRDLPNLPPESEFAAISLSDTGCGIAPNLLSQVFEPFFTTKEVGRGTGLGLSQVYGFAKQSGGDVSIESEVGEGAPSGSISRLCRSRTDSRLRRSLISRLLVGPAEGAGYWWSRTISTWGEPRRRSCSTSATWSPSPRAGLKRCTIYAPGLACSTSSFPT